jgi:four helix bundle protein
MPVWQDAQDIAVSVYKITDTLPKHELYSLGDQIRRAASSVSANIAEGFGRATLKDRAHFYHIALGSLLETKNYLYLCEKLGYIDKTSLSSHVESIEGVQRQITAIIKYFKDA